MCAPRWHGTHRYDIQVLAARANVGASIFFTAAMIRAFWSARSRGNGGIPGLWHIPKEKITGLMSGDLWGHSFSGWSFPYARPIQRSGNTVFRYWRNSRCKWAGLPSCWNMDVGMFCSCDISHSCNMSRYVMSVTVSSAKKNEPYTFWLEIAQNTLT